MTKWINNPMTKQKSGIPFDHFFIDHWNLIRH